MRFIKTKNELSISLLIFFVLIFIQFVSLAQSKNVAKGIVFNDLNNNGILDKNEPGIVDVVVSNQLEAVKTDAKGRYSLPVNGQAIIFVSKPSGYNVPLNENNLPMYYYIHHPKGSPEGLDYKGIEPTGELPKRLNFPLLKSEVKNNFNAIVTGDPQPYVKEHVNHYIDDVVTEMIDYDSDFYIALGDIVEDDLSLYGKINRGVKHLEIPAYNVIGNHDMNFKSKDNQFKAETFRKTFGPDYYSFNYGKVHFMSLNSIQYDGWNEDKNKQGRYRGGFDDKQLKWIANDLKFVPEDHLVVIITHIPILEPGMKQESSTKIFNALYHRKHLLALAGHKHTIENRSYNKDKYWNGTADFPYLVVGAACGSWWSKVKDERGIPLSVAQDGTPNGFFVFNFNENKYSFKFHPANHNPNFQMRISSPQGEIPLDSLENQRIIVNVFAGNPNDKVVYQLDDRPAVDMNNEVMKDPLVISFFKAYKDIDSWVKPSTTSHMWTEKLPEDLKVGSHILKITTTDMFGKTFTAYRIFEVEKN